MTVARLLVDAASVLGRVELVDDLTFSDKASVARVRMDGGRTVVVKQPGASDAFEREREAMHVLPEWARPGLVAAGPDFLVMEDLGPGPSLADLLLGQDPGAAKAALVGWARTVGRALRTTLCEGSDEEPDELGPGIAELARLASALDVPWPAGVEDDGATIAATLACTGPWLAFCPGDTCPDNNRVLDDGTVRLLDFEGAGWRHAALEAAYCRVPFCTCWCVARLPEGMTQEMEDAFLAGLAPAQPGAFVDVVPLAAVRYTLVTFAWFRRFVLDDRPVGPPGLAPSSGRQYVYERLLTVAGQRERLPALADVGGRLAARIVERWPEAAAMPLYPAFHPQPA